jgi:hypothetical protein
MSKDERKEFLDAIRPEAARQAGQPVRFKVDQLNHEAGWAVLFGSLLAEEGKVIDWRKAKECDPTLDKGLWVVAKKGKHGWQIKEMEICSPEPPYWYLDLKPEEAFARPCAIYAGLQILGNETAEQQCKDYQSMRRNRKKGRQ